MSPVACSDEKLKILRDNPISRAGDEKTTNNPKVIWVTPPRIFTGRFLERIVAKSKFPDREKSIGNELYPWLGSTCSRDTPKNENSFDRRLGNTNDNIHSDALQWKNVHGHGLSEKRIVRTSVAGFEPAAFRTGVYASNHWAMPAWVSLEVKNNRGCAYICSTRKCVPFFAT